MTKYVELHGHRGARGLWAENTLEGFRRTIALGVDAIEMDVAVTADGVVVVSHDPALNPNLTRDAHGAWLTQTGPLIRDLPVAALVAYDVGRLKPGTTYAARYPDQRPIDGARIPTLAEVIALDDRVALNIEIKTFPDHPEWTDDGASMARAVLATTDTAGVSERIRLLSFDWRPLAAIRASRPDIALTHLTRAETASKAALWWNTPGPDAFGGSVPRAVAAAGGESWGPEYVDLTEALVAEAHALGLKVRTWTVNDPADMRRLIGWGVDGLTTDRPDLARAVMAETGFAVPSPHPLG